MPFADPDSYAITNFSVWTVAYLKLLQEKTQTWKQASVLSCHVINFCRYENSSQQVRGPLEWEPVIPQTKRKLTSCLWWPGPRTLLRLTPTCPQFTSEREGQQFPVSFGSWPTFCLCIVSACWRLCFCSLGKVPQALTEAAFSPQCPAGRCEQIKACSICVGIIFCFVLLYVKFAPFVLRGSVYSLCGWILLLSSPQDGTEDERRACGGYISLPVLCHCATVMCRVLSNSGREASLTSTNKLSLLF